MSGACGIMVQVHSRQARPTLRVLQEDLTDGWDDPEPRRHLSNGNVDKLHPMSGLRHPIVAKASECFTDDAGDDNHLGPISSSSRVPLLEIRAGQWRGGVWQDPNRGVNWLIVAGLAKGGHEDRDDFYEQVKRENANGSPDRWLPTDADVRLLKRETAAHQRIAWEFAVQEQVSTALVAVTAGSTTRFEVQHPTPGNGRIATVELEMSPIREDDYQSDDLVVEIIPDRKFVGSALVWQLTMRTLISIQPPHEGWDPAGGIYSMIAEPGTWTTRIRELDDLAEEQRLAESVPGNAHYSHTKHLTDAAVNGEAVRALCGKFFVPTRDPENLTKCPTCKERWDELPP